MRPLLFTLITLTFVSPAFAADPAVLKQTIKFTADDKKEQVPELFRLPVHEFCTELTTKHVLACSEVSIHKLTFPSPVKSADECNNTVHATYFKPNNAGKKPAVVILDIMDGQQIVSESQAMWLAQNDVAALVVFMAYYGPRRPEGSKERMLSLNLDKSVANVRQTVLDCRRAVAWLAAQEDVNPEKLSILGTSLGSFVGGVVAAAEPRLRSACLLLGGGALVESFWEHPKAKDTLKILEQVGLKKDGFKKTIDPVDPITYADILKKKRLLLIGASRDDVVPPIAMKRLWEATGKQEKMTWVDATHVGAALHMFDMMRAVTKHVKE